jgi:ornithine cyclodeaminase/alanine dehydrogenase-like protein (mu-crystallin family)
VVFAAAAPRELRCAGDGADAFGGRVTSVAEACACDIVCVTQPEVAPTLQRAWFRRGTHVIAFGPLDPDVLDGAKITYDDQPGGWGTLGEVAAGIKDGRELDELTVYLAPVQDRKRDH